MPELVTGSREALAEPLATVGWVTPDTPDGPALVRMRADTVARHLIDSGAVMVIDPGDSGLVWRLHLASEVPPDEVKAVLRALAKDAP